MSSTKVGAKTEPPSTAIDTRNNLNATKAGRNSLPYEVVGTALGADTDQMANAGANHGNLVSDAFEENTVQSEGGGNMTSAAKRDQAAEYQAMMFASSSGTGSGKLDKSNKKKVASSEQLLNSDDSSPIISRMQPVSQKSKANREPKHQKQA